MTGLGDKPRGLEFAKATIVTKLNGQAAQIPGRHEQLTLQVASLIPGRLPAGGGIQGENQPALPPALLWQFPDLVDKLVDRLFIGFGA